MQKSIVRKTLFFFLSLLFVPVSTMAQEEVVNLTYNGGMESMVPMACPRWQALSRGLQTHIDYLNDFNYPSPRILGWFGTHTEFILNEDMMPGGCPNSFNYPSKVPGTTPNQSINGVGVFPSTSTGTENNVFVRVYSGYNSHGYRTEYLNGELLVPLYKGIRYETSFDFAHNGSAATKIGFKKLSILFYDQDAPVDPDTTYPAGAIQLPYIYALPPIDLNVDSIPINWNGSGVVQNSWSLTDDVDYWTGRQAGLHVINKELEVDGNGQEIPDVWGNPTFIYDNIQEKYLFQVNWETVKNHSWNTKYYIPQTDFQDTFTAGVFYQHRLFDAMGNDIGYNNPSNSLDQPGGHTGTTNYGLEVSNPPIAGDSHTGSYYYDNFSTYCKSDPMFKLTDSQYQDINNGEFNKGFEGREVEVKCGEELDFKALYQNSFPKEQGFVANYKFYRWSVEGINVFASELYSPIELDFDDISNLYVNAPVQSLFDLDLPSNFDYWGNKEFYLGMETTCLPLSFNEVPESQKWTRFDNSEKLKVKVKAPEEGEIKIIVEGGPGNQFQTGSGYKIIINHLSQALKDYGLNVHLEGYDGYDQVELLWSVHRLDDNDDRLDTIIEDVNANNLWLRLDDMNTEPTLAIPTTYEIVANLKIGKNCFHLEKSFFVDVVIENNHNGEVTAEQLGIYAPNAFSPNNDGVNDTYFFNGDGNVLQFYKLKSFQVFNRWGAKVHEASGSFDVLDWGSYEWTGRDRQSPTIDPIAVYVYLAIFEHNGNEFKLSGDITVVR